MKGDPIYTDATLRHRYDYREAARIGDWIILQWRDEHNYEAYLCWDVIMQGKIKPSGTIIFTADRTQWAWVADWWVLQHRNMAAIKGTDVTDMLERLSVYCDSQPTEMEHFI